MSKFDPLQMSRPPAVVDTRTFTDPLQPNCEVTLTFTADPQYGSSLASVQNTQKYTELYIAGKNGGPPAFLPPVGGRGVVITRELVAIISNLESMETPGDGEEKWSFMQWRALAANAPTMFQDIIEWANELREKAAGEVKN